MLSRLRQFWSLLKQAAIRWNDDDASWLAAALAYYTIFSLAPVLIIVVAIAGFVFGERAVQGEIEKQMAQFIGSNTARIVEDIVSSAARPTSGIVATIIGVLALFFGATNVFTQLQGALNKVWRVDLEHRSWVTTQLIHRLTSTAIILSIGFVILVSLVVDTVLAGFGDYVVKLVPNVVYVRVIQLGSVALSFAMATLLFAVIFKTIPQTDVAWRDVWLGALISALLFSIGKSLLGLYVGSSLIVSAFGAAGSIIVILLWFYYSAQILFFGAEFCYVYAIKSGSRSESEKAEKGDSSPISVAK